MIEFSGKSKSKYSGQTNEDSIGWNPSAGIWVLSDGMGGHRNGHFASTIVVETIMRNFSRKRIPELITMAHAEIQNEVRKNSELKGMGATVVIAHVSGHKVGLHWVGDSRAYLFRQQSLKQLSVDHSYVQLLIEKKMITTDEAENHSQKNILVQALGVKLQEQSSKTINLINRDRILLCSDGLSNELTNSEITSILTKAKDTNTAVDELIETASNGNDDVSVILLHYRVNPLLRMYRYLFFNDSVIISVLLGVFIAIITIFVFFYVTRI